MKNRQLKDSFKNAFRGIYQVFKTESNIKLHSLAAVLAVILAFILDFNTYEWTFIVIAIVIVIVTEILNTAVEYAIDMVCGDTYNEIAKYAKDIAAGATLISAISAIVIGALLYIPKLLDLIL